MPQTITQALTRDHNAVMREIAAVRADPRQATRMYPGIADAIRRHSAAEEATFYQALAGVSAPDARVVATLEMGHRQIGTALDNLGRTPYGSPQFMMAFWQMAALLGAHIRYEEATVFPHADRVLPRARQYSLAKRYDARMGEGRTKNISILLPSTVRARNGSCGCQKNPCGCALPKPNARRPRAKWYHHFMGVAPVFMRRKNPCGCAAQPVG